LATSPTPTLAAREGQANPGGAALVPAAGTALAQPAGAAVGPRTGLVSIGQMTLAARAVLAQPAVRRALPALIIVAVLVLFAITWAAMQATPYRNLLPGLNESDRQAAFDLLRNADFKPRIDANSGELSVASARYHEARMLLASQGLPRTSNTGLDALKDQSSMTTSQFMEQVRVNAAMEQELARSIMQIASVHSARVHLAQPKQSVFVRDRTPPKASVVVAPHPGRVVSPSQVQAIVHLVSSSVPYLAPENVTVVDNIGQLLTESAGELKLGLTAAQAQHKQQMEEVYRSRIVQILAPVVGETNVRTQVNLVLDFTQVESTSEDYDTRSQGPRTRSETLAQDRAARRDAAGIPGSLSNTAPAPPTTTTTTAANTAEGRSESDQTLSSRSTRNYELDRSVRHVKNATGTVQRVSVAVVVNEKPAPVPPEGSASAPPPGASVAYTPQELDRMRDLVRSVVGYDTKRGDEVTVVPARFEPGLPLETIPWYLETRVHEGLKSGMIALAFIAFLLVVVRPILQQFYAARKEASEQAAADAKARAESGELTEEDLRLIQIGEGESLEQIKAKLKPKKSSISADLLDTANTYDDKVALIRMLVAEDSGRVANVLKAMIRVS
jgi:flagellar M-ring protein FliF